MKSVSTIGDGNAMLDNQGNKIMGMLQEILQENREIKGKLAQSEGEVHFSAMLTMIIPQ